MLYCLMPLRKKIFLKLSKIKLTETAKTFIAEKGYDIQFGARPLKRAIQKYLEDPMAEVLIKSDMKEGDTISVGFNKKTEEITIKIQTKESNSKEVIAGGNSED